MIPPHKIRYLPILLLIAIQLAFGTATLPDYGESWDEARLYEYGEQSLNAYRALIDPSIPVDFGDDDLRYYGPAYFMGMSLLVHGIHNNFPQVPIVDLWHLGNFICLQFGLLCFYILLSRFIHWVPAFATTALFASQPLVWGHGFINPKDIPFMAFFTASILFGIKMLDSYEKQNYEFKALIKSPWFFAAALGLGLTISIRILGFAAAGVLLFYFAFKNIGKVLRLSYGYFGLALAVSFLTWPYLWPSPVANFIKGIYAMLKFQWIGHTLFNGIYYPSNQLPREYVPQLLLMQFTEPVLLLFAGGLMALLLPHFRQRYRSLASLFAAWFILPMLYILVNGLNLYDNTRQLLFSLPGAFLVVAAGLDLLFSRLKTWPVQTLITIMILLPGLAGIVKYHPYEYTYYNLSTTATRQIFRNFETDYWATSFKQAALFINDQAPEEALVIVWGPAQLIQRYARQDIQVKSFDDLDDHSYAENPYYLVLTTRYDMDLKFFPEVDPVHSVQHNDSILAVVKYITP